MNQMNKDKDKICYLPTNSVLKQTVCVSNAKSATFSVIPLAPLYIDCYTFLSSIKREYSPFITSVTTQVHQLYRQNMRLTMQQDIKIS